MGDVGEVISSVTYKITSVLHKLLAYGYFFFSFCEKRFYLYTHFVWATSPKGKAAGHESDHSFHLVPMLRMDEAILPHPHASSWAAGGQLYLYINRVCRG